MNKRNIAYGLNENKYYTFDEIGIVEHNRKSCISYRYDWSDLKELQINKKHLVMEFVDGKVFVIYKDYRTPGVMNRIANLADPYKKIRIPPEPEGYTLLGYAVIICAILIAFGIICVISFLLK